MSTPSKLINATQIKSVCIIRLSAIGDVTNTALVISTLRDDLPSIDITWIININQYELVKHLNNIHFILFDKHNKIKSLWKIWCQLRSKRFDILLLMQYSLRANLISLLVNSPLRIGYRYPRSHEGHHLFINHQVGNQREHVMDTYFSFIDALGITQRTTTTDTLFLAEDIQFAKQYINTYQLTLLISPCASEEIKQWNARCYAKFADYAINQHSMQVILCADNKLSSLNLCKEIQQQMINKIVNLAGQTTINQLCALIHSSDITISPDSASVHIASAVNTPVIGLYATTNPDRAGPYNSQQWCVNQYPQSANIFLNQSVDDIRWGRKIRYEGVTDLIELDSVCGKLDKLIHHLQEH